MIISNVKLIVIGAIGAIGSELGLQEDAISQSVAEWGVTAGIIIGGIGAGSRLFEVISGQVLKWMEYFDKKRAAKEQKTQNKKPSD